MVSDEAVSDRPQTYPDVIDDSDNSRYLLEQDRYTAELDYEEAPGELILVHTGVPVEIRNQGIAGRLVQAAIFRAATEGLTVVPHCSYARKWLDDHPEVASSLTVEWSA